MPPPTRDGGIGEGAAHVGGDAFVVVHLLHRFAQRVRQGAAELACLYEMEGVVRQVESARPQGAEEVLPAQELSTDGLEAGDELRVVAAATLRRHRVAEGHAGFEQGGKFAEGHHQIAGAEAAANGEAGGDGLASPTSMTVWPSATNARARSSDEAASASPLTVWPSGPMDL